MDKWTTPIKPINIKATPWLAADAISYFEGLLQPEFTVMEFGGGGSTLWLSSRVKSVLTYENNREWMEQIQTRAGGNVILLPSATPPPYAAVDLLFIDGEPVQARGEWMDAAPHLVKGGGLLVLDNANRPEYAGAWNLLQKRAELLYRVTTGGGRYFVTEFYRMHDA